jgi:LuxR family maltose regulon positive regulatory protein
MLAVLKQAFGDVEGALSQLRNLNRLATKVGSTVMDDRLRAETTAMNIRLLLRQDHPELEHLLSDVASWVEARQLRPDDELEYSREPEYLLLARLLIIQERPGEAQPLLERLVHAAESAGRVGNQIDYLVTLALAQTRNGEAATALTTLTQALSLAEPEGYVRTFVDCGHDMQGLLQLVAKRGTASNYVSKLLEAFDPVQGGGGLTKVEKSGVLPVRPESVAQRSLLEPLNERELAILKFMAVRLSNREIASELYLSVNTVRWHAHNLFVKLGVGGRAEAVSRARDLNLL